MTLPDYLNQGSDTHGGLTEANGTLGDAVAVRGGSV